MFEDLCGNNLDGLAPASAIAAHSLYLLKPTNNSSRLKVFVKTRIGDNLIEPFSNVEPIRRSLPNTINQKVFHSSVMFWTKSSFVAHLSGSNAQAPVS